MGWESSFNGTAEGRAEIEGGSAKLAIEKDGVEIYNVGFWQSKALEAGAQYTISFDIKTSSAPKSFQFFTQLSVAPWTLHTQRDLEITQAAGQFQSFTHTWTQKTNDPNARIGFRLGDRNDKDVWIDNVSLKKNKANPPTNPGAIRVGVYPGSRGDIEKYERDLAVDLKHRLIFQPVKELDFSKVKAQLDRGNEVILNIEFFENFPNLDEVNAGVYDSYLKRFANELKNDGREIWLRPLHEFNGNWYSWNVLYDESHNLQDFKNAWRHVVNLFRRSGAKVKFQLNYNQFNGKEDRTPFSAFYPGDEFVDMVMVTAYNRAGTDQWHEEWNSFYENFKQPYDQIVSFTNKPIGVAEMSTTSNLGGNKPKWIREAFSALAYDFPRVRQITWFLINKQYSGEGKRDWDLNTDEDEEAFVQGYNLLKKVRP